MIKKENKQSIKYTNLKFIFWQIVPLSHRDRSGEGKNIPDIQRICCRPTKRYPSEHFNRQTEPSLRSFVQLLSCIFGREIALHFLKTEIQKNRLLRVAKLYFENVFEIRNN